MDKCPFCRIVSHSDRALVLLETDSAISFLDYRPIAVGHALVTTKWHFKDLYEIDDDSLSEVYLLAKKVSIAISRIYRPLGINLMQNNGVYAGQTVFHFHVHVIPRYDSQYNEILEKIAWTRKIEEESELIRVQSDIKKELGSL